MDWMTVKEASELWDLSVRRITTLCATGRVRNAVKKNKMWLIPNSAERPKDARFKTGKFVGYYQKYKK